MYITLTCSVILPVSVVGTPTFKWYNPAGVSHNTVPYFVEEVVYSNLTLGPIRTSQAGQYTCIATLGGSNTTSYTMTVHGKLKLTCWLHVLFQKLSIIPKKVHKLSVRVANNLALNSK